MPRLDTMMSFDLSTVEGAHAFIHVAHDGQTDMAGSPYVLHPIAVFEMLGVDAPLHRKLTALLHDVLEDCFIRDGDAIRKVSADDLRRWNAPAPVVHNVVMLTRPDANEMATTIEEHRRQQQSYLDKIRNYVVSGNVDVMLVKLADNRHNASPQRLENVKDEAARAKVISLHRRWHRSIAILEDGLRAHGIAI